MATILTTAGHFDRSRGNRGEVSDINRLQDGRFYQTFSYVIKSGVDVKEWFDIVTQTIHPAGMAVFGETNIETITDPYLSSRASDYNNMISTSVGVFGPVQNTVTEIINTNTQVTLLAQNYASQIYFAEDYCASVSRFVDAGIPVNDVTIVETSDQSSVVYI